MRNTLLAIILFIVAFLVFSNRLIIYSVVKMDVAGEKEERYFFIKSHALKYSKIAGEKKIVAFGTSTFHEVFIARSDVFKIRYKFYCYQNGTIKEAGEMGYFCSDEENKKSMAESVYK